MGTFFKLDIVIDELQITPNKLASLSGVRPDTVYKIYNNQMRRIHIDVLDSLLDALNTYSKDKEIRKSYSISDILDYKKTKK
ncbi:helix-turn-helix domain-containing protein [Rossellomorea marisflavi]|uniref:helix-turn-helix domain-containing protein n=1 Tax=Rossellomorea marisflavi TaxID=189381 RepID=UPI0039BF6F56